MTDLARDEMARPIRHRPQWFLVCWAILLSSTLIASAALAEELLGSLVMAGRGPERPVMEELARAFERAHLGTVVDIKWNRNFRIGDLVTSNEVDIGVVGQEEPDLVATTVAWDGLAVIVNFSNPIKEVTIQQVASLFSGTVRDWSNLDKRAGGPVHLVLRPDDQNMTDGFEQSLGIVGRSPKNAEHIRSNQQVLSRVSGKLDAVGYLSLKEAQDAVTYGMSVRALLIDGVEPGTPTVESGQYRLKRPVVLLMRKEATALARAFVDFARSPAGQGILETMYVPLVQHPR
ncbi:MAG: substrate-binding domain-containing protein [Nitrospirota bacterium]|nr:substrate-binding domain-containing protein [Nitrospirota bacterium]